MPRHNKALYFTDNELKHIYAALDKYIDSNFVYSHDVPSALSANSKIFRELAERRKKDDHNERNADIEVSNISG